MEKDLKQFLLEFDLTKDEIENIVNIAPMMDVTTLQEFKQNANLLIRFGYPKEDLIELLLVNPNIFAMDANTLQNDLQHIKAKFGDIEEAIKNDPFLL